MAAEVPHADEDEGDDAYHGGEAVEVAQAHEECSVADGTGHLTKGCLLYTSPSPRD